MEPFATKQQMADMSQGEIPASTPFLDEEIKAATQRIRDYCRWHVAKVETGLVHRHRSRFREEVWLPAFQVAAVAAVTIDGKVHATPADIDFDPKTGWTSIVGRDVKVTYSAGYAEVPDALVSLTLLLASRALGNPLGIVRQQVGPSSVTYSTAANGVAAGGSLLPGEMDQLDAYRIGWIG